MQGKMVMHFDRGTQNQSTSLPQATKFCSVQRNILATLLPFFTTYKKCTSPRVVSSKDLQTGSQATSELLVISMVHASCQLSSAYKLDVLPRFLENVKCSDVG